MHYVLARVFRACPSRKEESHRKQAFRFSRKRACHSMYRASQSPRPWFGHRPGVCIHYATKQSFVESWKLNQTKTERVDREMERAREESGSLRLASHKYPCSQH